MSCFSSNILDVLDIIELLADSSIKQLQIMQTSMPGGLTHAGCFSGQLFSKIDSANIIGLHKLIVKVHLFILYNIIAFLDYAHLTSLDLHGRFGSIDYQVIWNHEFLIVKNVQNKKKKDFIYVEEKQI